MIKRWKQALICWLLACFTVVSAQDSICPDLVESALQVVDEFCATVGRNQACYGNFMLQADFKSGVDNIDFSESGDLAAVADIEALELGTLDEASGGWGVAVLSLQANIPDTLPGQNVTFVLIGDTSIENAASADQNPMQAFYLRTGVGDAPCAEAPESGLLVQTPEGVEEVTFNLNGVDVSIGSTAFFQAQPEGDMIISTIEGAVVLGFDGDLFPVLAGSRVRMRLGANLLPIERPRLPESYDLANLGELPLRLLERRIEIAQPLSEENLALLRESLQSGEVPCDMPGFPSCERVQRFTVNAANWVDGSGWGTQFLPGENCRLPGTTGDLPLCPIPENAPRIADPEFREALRERACEQYPADQLPIFCQSLTEDRDGDGVVDGEDRCPNQPGSAQYLGCNPTDSDGDGVFDLLDRCPNVAGSRDYRGCNPTDTDGDGVLDPDDRCPNQAGFPIANGCVPPDTDGDGIYDPIDRCPNQVGHPDYQGCVPPDTDGDGVLDPDDRCPNQAGFPIANGCVPPDTDGDGIYDPIDRCPNQAGHPDYQGCVPPDTDGDGVLDPDDRCPNQAGFPIAFGCIPPDTDGDGIYDPIDRCPNQAGHPDYQGCVPPDTDGDGVLDPDDRCPNQAGFPIANGCIPPDTDGDGIYDPIDRCPNRPGPLSNGGCPLPTPTPAS